MAIERDMTWDTNCASRHLGLWMVEPYWFFAALNSVQAGTYPVLNAAQIKDKEGETLFDIRDNGVAVVAMSGQMMKGDSKFGGVNTLRTRRAIREATQNDSVEAILLHIDSPGGTVAGTADLAADVQTATRLKPVSAHIDDLGASAAFWVASQAGRITANKTAEIGSIGTVAVARDTSGKAEMEGVKVHVLSTGEFKGSFADGAPVKPEHLAELQDRVDALNVHFLQGVAKGRRMPLEVVRKLADGRVHISSAAMGLGLIDRVASMDDAIQMAGRDARDARRIRKQNRKLQNKRLDGLQNLA